MKNTCHKIHIKRVGNEYIVDIHDLYATMCADSNLLQTTIYEVLSNCLSDSTCLLINRSVCINKIQDIMEDNEVHDVFKKLLSYIDMNILPNEFQIYIWR